MKKLSHPLSLLLIGAAISSYLVPTMTRRWQDHQKELELKTELVSEISESVTSTLMAVQFAEVGAKSQKPEDFDRAYREWEIKSGVIGSRLRAYFPDTAIGPDWDNFASWSRSLRAHWHLR